MNQQRTFDPPAAENLRVTTWRFPFTRRLHSDYDHQRWLAQNLRDIERGHPERIVNHGCLRCTPLWESVEHHDPEVAA